MKNTMILKPLEEDYDSSENDQDSASTGQKQAKPKQQANYMKIQEVLNSMKFGEDISFDDFLSRLELTEEQHLLALQSSIKKPKIFLKRKPSEIRMNMRNSLCAAIWHANCDLQFILDPYTYVAYIVSYISKGQRGMSQLLEQASEEAKNGNYSVKEQLRIICNKFLNHCEVSAQEAVYLLLQLPMCRCMRSVRFVNTGPPNERVSILKSKTLLDQMDAESTDVLCKGLLNNYAERPSQLENVCLAEFASCFEKKKKPSTRKKQVECYLKEDAYDEDKLDDPDIQDDIDVEYVLEDGTILYQRKVPKILRCVRYSVHNDPENYYREKIMLYLPWREEEIDIIKNFPSYQMCYLANRQTIDDMCLIYENCAVQLDEAAKLVFHEMGLQEEWDKIAPETREEVDKDENVNVDSTILEHFIHKLIVMPHMT